MKIASLQAARTVELSGTGQDEGGSFNGRRGDNCSCTMQRKKRECVTFAMHDDDERRLVTCSDELASVNSSCLRNEALHDTLAVRVRKLPALPCVNAGNERLLLVTAFPVLVMPPVEFMEMRLC